MAGNGTIGLELVEDLEAIDTVLVPWGGGGLTTGIASALAALSPATRVLACEPETGAPFAASLAAGTPVEVDYTPSFVDGAGSKMLLGPMWERARPLLSGARRADARRDRRQRCALLAERARVVAEGAGALAVAAALSGRAGEGRIVCIVSGGNIDAARLAAILEGHTPETPKRGQSPREHGRGVPCGASPAARRPAAASSRAAGECVDANRLPHRPAPDHDRGAGIRDTLPDRHGGRGRGDDPAPLVRPARLDLGRRAQPPDRARLTRRRVQGRHRGAAARARARVRVLGARGVPAAGRGVAALRRRRCATGGRRWYGDVGETHPHLADEILAEIRARGPLGSRHFEGTSEGGMWNWKPAKAMLDLLWNHGDLVIAGRQGFQRLYDLPERVIPKEILAAPVPDDEARLRALAEKAVAARGALTESGIVEHWRLRGGTKRIRPVVDALVADGVLERVAVDDGGAPVIVPAGAALDPAAPTAAVLLSPFDNLLWDRPFARRVLGFDHLIEVYKKEHERRYGYYVLPFLWRDRIVGRADLKSERAEGALVVKAFHREDGVRDSAALGDAFDRALDRLRRACGLETVR